MDGYFTGGTGTPNFDYASVPSILPVTLAPPLGSGRAAPSAGPSRGRGGRAGMGQSRIAERLGDVLGSAPRSGPAICQLRTDGLGKRYGETVALSAVSMTFEPRDRAHGAGGRTDRARARC